MKNNYMNQLLKYTHTHTKYIYIHIIKKKNKKNHNNKKKAVQPSFPKKKKDFYYTPDRGSHGNSQRIGAVNCCRKDLHPRHCSCPSFSSFLCKCNLTKS